MTEKPILFSGPMVRAILEGRKTQTRRVLKSVGDFDQVFQMDDGSWHITDSQGGHMSPVSIPYSVGDRLWVRESFRQAYQKTTHSEGFIFRADRPKALGMQEYSDHHNWKPSIHMPRRICRITLEVTAVKVERLQDISEADAEAEGAACDDNGCDHPRHTCAEAGCIGRSFTKHRAGFAQIWIDINGRASWDANPWVAAYTFKRVTP